MSKSLEEILKEDKLQVLNDDKLKRFSLREDKFASNVSRLSEAVGKIYSDELADDGQDEYQARCLAAIADPTNQILGEVSNDEESNSKFLIRVIARIPKLHASIPKPDGELCQVQKNLAIAMHPEFYALQGDNSVPEPGNLIKVKFFTNGQGGFGEYLGIIDANVKATTDTPISAKDAVENKDNAQSTVEEVT
tara:strand:- start:166 stop:744 length:579 start_codon:yes stop_codon:yes gene_type:complete